MRRYVIPGIFVLSGAAGLIFEVVWARQLVLVFGNTTHAISAILTGFFGGMALGSWHGGKVADRAARPLRLYAVLELSLAIVVVLTPLTFGLIHEAYRSAFSALEVRPVLLGIVRFILALAALAPATVLMGATLPTLTRYLAREQWSIGSAFTRLYVANTMGAVFGAAAAGFFLIELLGLSGALLVGAGCSAIAGLIALLLDFVSTRNAEPAAPHPASNGAATRSTNVNLALGFAFVSGFTSLAYQTLWTRLIASGTGSSTYVFTTILTVFLTGLALGSVEYKRVRDRLHDVVGSIALSQLAIALFGLLGMIAINALDTLTGAFVWKTLVAVLPATFMMGFSFPAASALIGNESGAAGTKSGALLATNTVGAILGTVFVPFLLIPWLGSPTVLGLVVAVNAVTAIAIATRSESLAPRRRMTVVWGSTACLILVAISIVAGSLFVDPNVHRMHRIGATLYRSAEDEIASVQAGDADGRKQLWVTGFSMTFLTVDAKLMPLLPLMLRPTSTSVLTIAFGMGSSFRSALIAGMRSDAVELVPSVPKMFGLFYGDSRAYATSTRGRIIVGDGRSYAELTDRYYDIVVVDPPPPLQSSGVSIISSREFYVASKKRLNPGGVMMQWVPWGQSMSDFKNHVRTFRSVFPEVIVAEGPGGNGFYMLGSESRMAFQTANITAALSRPHVLDDISSAYDSPTHDLAAWERIIPKLVRLSGSEVAAFAGPGPLITDDRPLPEYFLVRTANGAETRWLDPASVKAPNKESASAIPGACCRP